MTEVPISLPKLGVSDAYAKGEQEPGTAYDAINWKGFEAGTGRLRDGVREGTEKITNAQVNGSAPVRALEQVSFAPPLFTYAQYGQGNHVEEWKIKTPLTSDCRAAATDFERNVYVLDGRAGVAKYNADGKLVWKFVLPVASQE